MLLPNLSTKDAQEIRSESAHRTAYIDANVRARNSSEKLIKNQARVLLNQLILRGENVDYLGQI